MKKIELQKAREQIDKIDGEISELIERRIEIAKEIICIKKENGLEIEDKGREDQIISNVIFGKKAGKLIENIYKKIFDWVKS